MSLDLVVLESNDHRHLVFSGYARNVSTNAAAVSAVLDVVDRYAGSWFMVKSLPVELLSAAPFRKLNEKVGPDSPLRKAIMAQVPLLLAGDNQQSIDILRLYVHPLLTIFSNEWQ